MRTNIDNEEGKLAAHTIAAAAQLRQPRLLHPYCTNAQSRALRKAFVTVIPYRIYGGLSTRKEIMILVAYSARDHELPAMRKLIKRIINYPVRGIGKTTIEKVSRIYANDQNITFLGSAGK